MPREWSGGSEDPGPPPEDASPMHRRDFLRDTLAAGAATGMLPHSAAAARYPSPPDSSSPAIPFDLDEVTVAALQEGMASGRWTARGVTEEYLARIEAVDKGRPALNPSIERNPA